MGDLYERARQALPTGTVTFLFTDIEGSASLAQNFPDELNFLLAKHHEILRQCIEGHNGHVYQIIGDAFASAFQSSNDAVIAAVEAQRRLLREASHPAPIKVRMGIHTGEARANTLEDIAGGYDGYLTLTRVQRVMSAAHGGQVLLSGVSAELVRGELPKDFRLRDMGEHRLKGLVATEHLWQLIAPDLTSEFPPLNTLSVLPNNLPVQLTSFIGREYELAQTKELLTNTHLLTLTGPGGTGKTRLALQLAATVLPEFADGVWLVELASLVDPGLVLPTIAATFGLREVLGASLKELVIQYLRARHLLLILDNCEHLVETCALLADDLLRSCPKLTIIASSRENLGITGEIVFRVPPLALPDIDRLTLETLRRSEAVQLFLERASAVKPGFVLDGHNMQAVAKICQRLDGIPLALELAAARIVMLTPEQIASRLEDRFRLLTGGSRTALPRQQTLRSLIDWSYDLLSEPERLLFGQLSVFVGGWSMEAAEAVCVDLDVLDLLNGLVQKSLVVAEEYQGAAATRFRLLETIRQYARDMLLETGEAAQVRNRHLDYFLKFAEAGEANFFGRQRLKWIDLYELEHDNFRAALQWGLDHDVDFALRLGGVLATFWNARGYSVEGHRWIQAALDRADLSPAASDQALRHRQAARARALNGLSLVAIGDGDYQAGLEAGQEAVRLYRELGDRYSLGLSLAGTGFMAALQGDLSLADRFLEEAIQLGRELDARLILAYALGVQSGNIFLPRGDLEAAQAAAEESARYSREIGLPWSEGMSELIFARIAALEGRWDEARRHALKAMEVHQDLRDPLVLNQSYSQLGDIELRAGNLAEALRYHRQAILAWKELGQSAFVVHELESFAYLAQTSNQPDRAARLLGAAEALREGIGTSAFGVERLQNEYEAARNWLRDQSDEAGIQDNWFEGRSMSMDQAVNYAMEG